jgi:hypothetical protein
MRKRTFGRWATRLALVAALGVGAAAVGLAAASVHDVRVLADISWQSASTQPAVGGSAR